MPLYLLALLIGVIAGLRAMTAPAVVSWAAGLGWIDLSGTWLSFLASVWTRWIFTVLALLELVRDQLPSTPPRTEAVQFVSRILMGALCGAALAGVAGSLLGAAGVVIGTLGGRAFRARLAGLLGSDSPAAFIEDAVAILGALMIVMAAR
jgi:uncharacterized membrane protein